MNGCYLRFDSARLRILATGNRAAGTEKSAVQVSMCAGMCQPQSYLSHSSIVGDRWAQKKGVWILGKRMTYTRGKSGYTMQNLTLSISRRISVYTYSIVASVELTPGKMFEMIRHWNKLKRCISARLLLIGHLALQRVWIAYSAYLQTHNRNCSCGIQVSQSIHDFEHSFPFSLLLN